MTAQQPSGNRPYPTLPAAADLSSGEAGHPAAAGCTAPRHDATRAAYQAGCRCPGAIAANRAYYREYERLRRQQPVGRELCNARARRRKRRILADPVLLASYNARRRAWSRQRRALEQRAAMTTIDPVVVERLVDGEDVPHNRVEKVAALHRLIGRGLSVSAAAQQLGINGQYARKYADLIEQGDVA